MEQNKLIGRYNQINPVIHSPARLLILSILELLEYADFKYILNETGLTKGNLSTHMAKLEKSGYILTKKEFINNLPLTTYKITGLGIAELSNYKEVMKSIIEF